MIEKGNLFRYFVDYSISDKKVKNKKKLSTINGNGQKQPRRGIFAVLFRKAVDEKN